MIPSAFTIYQPPVPVREQKTEIVFNESKLRDRDFELDKNALQYFREAQYRAKYENTDLLFMTLRLKELVKFWEKDMAESISSSISSIIDNKHFTAIVSYGDAIVPSILNQLQEQPSHLVWALNLITGLNISDKPISLDQASQLWVKWGKSNHLIS